MNSGIDDEEERDFATWRSLDTDLMALGERLALQGFYVTGDYAGNREAAVFCAHENEARVVGECARLLQSRPEYGEFTVLVHLHGADGTTLRTVLVRSPAPD